MNKAKIEARFRHCKQFSFSLVYFSHLNHFATSFSNFLNLYNLVKMSKTSKVQAYFNQKPKQSN